MSQDPLVNKLRNYYSFGRESMYCNQDGIVTGESLNLHRQQSFSFDLQKDLDGLGMQIVNASQKQFDVSENSDKFTKIDKVQFERFIKFVKQSLIGIKLQANKIKEEHEKFIVHLVNHDFVKQLQQKMNQEQPLSYKNVQESLKSKFGYRNEERKSKVLKKIENIMKIHTIEGIPLQNNEMQNNSIDNAFMNEIKILKNQVDCKTNQIFLLKRQLEAIKSLSDKKQSYFLQMMKVRQLQWDRKVKSMSGSVVNGYHMINYVIKHDSLSQNKQKRVFTEGCESLTQRFKSPMGNFLSNVYEMHDSLNIGIEKKQMKRSNFKIGNVDNSSQYYGKDEKQDNERQVKIVERAIKRKDRKRSTDCSFQRVSQKIKILQSSIKR